MAVILIVIIILLLVLLGWTWSSLGNIENKTKIICMIVGFVSTYIITLIIYKIAQTGIIFENPEVKRIIQNVFVLIFAIVNGYIILPYTFRKIEKIHNEEIEINQARRSIIILSAIILILIIFENLYLKNIIQGVLIHHK